MTTPCSLTEEIWKYPDKKNIQGIWEGARVRDRTIWSNLHNIAQFLKIRTFPQNSEKRVEIVIKEDISIDDSPQFLDTFRWGFIILFIYFIIILGEVLLLGFDYISKQLKNHTRSIDEIEQM